MAKIARTFGVDVTQVDVRPPTAATPRPSAPSPRTATSTAPTARQLPKSGPAGTIASPATRQRAAAPASTRVTGRMPAMRSTLPWTSPTPRAIVRAADRNGADSNQRGPLPRRAPGVGLVSGASGEGGAAPLLFGLLSFLLLLAIPTAVRWLRPAAALGLSPAYVALRDRPG